MGTCLWKPDVRSRPFKSRFTWGLLVAAGALSYEVVEDVGLQG